MMHFGKLRQLVFTFLFLLVASSASGQEGKLYKYRFPGNLNEGIIFGENQSIILNYSLTELTIESVLSSGGEFYRIFVPGHNPSNEEGKPELPVLSRLISIPDESTVTIRVTEVKSEIIRPSAQGFKGFLFPKQPGTSKSQQDQREIFVIDKKAYSSNSYIQSDTVEIENLGKTRGRQLATLMVYPVNYNPVLNELSVITSMKIEVDFSSTGTTVSLLKNASILFNQSIDKGMLNYNPSEVVPGYSDKPVRMIILTDPAYKKNLIPFLKWKTQQGYKLTTIYKGTGLSTFSQLKDSINKIYNASTLSNPAPEYVLIIGDINKIPNSVGNGTTNLSDMYYGEMDGNGDFVPDMYVGRLPVADTNELKATVGKIINYEKFQFADTNNYYKRALVTAGNDGSYSTYMNGQVKYEVTNYLNSTNKITGYDFFYPQASSNTDSIKKLIKKGLGFINYTGHGDEYGWLSPAIRSTDIPNLQNKNMYPFIISNACQTASYDVPGSFCNTLINTAEKGAIGYIGCTEDSFWDEDYFWAIGVGTVSLDPKYTETGLGALDRLFHTHSELPSDWYYTMGQINYAGNLAVSQSTTTKKKYYWETYTLLGDPSAIPYIGVPDSFKVALPDTLPNGITSISLSIPPFSYIAISHFDTLWDASFASPSGTVVLDFPSRSNDSCMIVITGQNKIPLIKTIKINDVKREFLNLTSATINDENANNNGLADFGEQIYLKLVINNLGKSDLSGLSAKLSSPSNYLTLTNDSVFIGSLNAKSVVTLPVCFGIKVAGLVNDKSTVTLNLKLSDEKVVKNYKVDVCIHAPILEIVNCIIDDSGTGNGNNIAEPGEKFKLIIKIKNSGSSNVSGTLVLINQPSIVTIQNPTVNTGNINYGAITQVPVSVQLSSSSPNGGTFDLTSVLNCNPYIKIKPFSIPIGKTRESFEYQKMNVFPWINSGSYPWITTGTQVYDGLYAARSGAIPNNAESLLKIKVNIPVADSVKFAAKVSSEYNYDYLYFRINGKEMFKISGEMGWTDYKFALKAGFNLLEWDYVKDVGLIGGSDCAWLDFIRFPSTAFSKTDLKTGKIVTPQPGKSLTQEIITAEVINLGTDTVKSFNLAYQVNSNGPVVQNFSKKINPSDTTVIAFSQAANLIGNGTYLITVYGLNNSDNYLYNDTARLLVVNTGIFDHVANPVNLLKIIPNPFTQSFRTELESPVSETVDISIFGESGNIVWNEKRYIIPGPNSITITPDRLTSGFYTLKISGKSIFRIARIIKIQ